MAAMAIGPQGVTRVDPARDGKRRKCKDGHHPCAIAGGSGHAENVTLYAMRLLHCTCWRLVSNWWLGREVHAAQRSLKARLGA